MYNILALVGEAGSGKDTILRSLIDSNYYEGLMPLHEVISYTSRAPREKEIDGVNYHFVSPEIFLNLIKIHQMFEYTQFNNWYYGTGVESLKENSINIGVFNPAGIKTLTENPDVNLVVIYIYARPKNRLLRQLNRELDPDVDEIIRRYQTDKDDFVGMVDRCNFLCLNNDKLDLEKNIKNISEFLTEWAQHLDKNC